MLLDMGVGFQPVDHEPCKTTLPLQASFSLFIFFWTMNSLGQDCVLLFVCMEKREEAIWAYGDYRTVHSHGQNDTFLWLDLSAGHESIHRITHCKSARQSGVCTYSCLNQSNENNINDQHKLTEGTGCGYKSFLLSGVGARSNNNHHK